MVFLSLTYSAYTINKLTWGSGAFTKNRHLPACFIDYHAFLKVLHCTLFKNVLPGLAQSTWSPRYSFSAGRTFLCSLPFLEDLLGIDASMMIIFILSREMKIDEMNPFHVSHDIVWRAQGDKIDNCT